MIGGKRASVFSWVIWLVGCSDFQSAAVEGGSTGDASGSGAASTNPATTNDPATSTDTAGNSTTSGDPTTEDPSAASSNSEGETTLDPMPISAGTSTDTGSSSGSSSDAESGSDASTGPMVCDQLDTEPNDTYLESQELPDQPCAVAAATLEGTLEDETDVDRFRFDSPWTSLDCGNGDPDHIYTVQGPVELCASPGCPSAMGSFTCEDGTVTNFSGFDYCCGTESVRIDVTCTLSPSSAGFVIVRPDADTLECADYSVTYQVVIE